MPGGPGLDELGGDVPTEGESEPDEEDDEDDPDLFDAPNLTAAPVGVIEGPERSAGEARCRQASEVRATWGEFVLATGTRV